MTKPFGENKMSLYWERICDQGAEATFRAKLPDGWIVKNVIYNSEGSSQSMVFIEDRNHKWRITD